MNKIQVCMCLQYTYDVLIGIIKIGEYGDFSLKKRLGNAFIFPKSHVQKCVIRLWILFIGKYKTNYWSDDDDNIHPVVLKFDYNYEVHCDDTALYLVVTNFFIYFWRIWSRKYIEIPLTYFLQ